MLDFWTPTFFRLYKEIWTLSKTRFFRFFRNNSWISVDDLFGWYFLPNQLIQFLLRFIFGGSIKPVDKPQPHCFSWNSCIRRLKRCRKCELKFLKFRIHKDSFLTQWFSALNFWKNIVSKFQRFETGKKLNF